MIGVRVPHFISITFVLSAFVVLSARPCSAQATTAGALEFTAHVRPAGGQTEPVRQLTFYLLSKSLSDIRKEVIGTEPPPDLDHFIAQLGVSAELKEWMKKHRRIDLAGNDFISEVSATDILDVPEFLTAYKNQNGAALHAGVPEPKFKKGDEEKNLEKYEREREQYRQALIHYIQANLEGLLGLDAEFRDTNPYTRWVQLQTDQQKRVEHKAMQIAQTQYLVATATTDLNGRATFAGLPPGHYWISNLDTAALAGDLRLHWDDGVTLLPAKTSYVELSDLNAVETSDQNLH
jgi:hypothetical protein